MANIYDGIENLIGKTPLIELKRYAAKRNLSARILVKAERFNPAGSAKDRVALQMLRDAEADGRVREGAVIIEPTSGNTGIGLAALCAVRGYKSIFVMPDTMSVERRTLLTAYGAQVVLTEGKRGMTGAIEKAQELAKEIPGSFVAGQFENPSNAKAHYLTTGPEIFEDTDGHVDAFVAGIGTGGTITGTGRYLKEKIPGIHIAAVEPSTSPVLSGGAPGAHKLQGIGAGFIPAVLDTEIYDEIIPADAQPSMEAARACAREEGLLVGISSGAALWAATTLAARPEYAGKTIVALLPDTGERYLSSELFAE